MRMNRNDEMSALEVVNNYSEEELTGIFFKYGEENRSRKIAAAISVAAGEKGHRHNKRTYGYHRFGHAVEFQDKDTV